MRVRSRKLCVAFITQLINANSATWYSNGVFGASNSETTIFSRYLVSFRFYRKKRKNYNNNNQNNKNKSSETVEQQE